MRTGSLRRSIALPDDQIGAHYSPDGLSEADIDAMLAQAGIDVDVDETREGDTAPVIALRPGEPDTRATQTGGEAA